VPTLTAWVILSLRSNTGPNLQIRQQLRSSYLATTRELSLRLWFLKCTCLMCATYSAKPLTRRR
jgi:hypothetical protein